MSKYYRPILQTDVAKPASAKSLAGGWCWFNHVEVMQRNTPSALVAADQVPDDVLANLCTPREPVAGLEFDAPRLMGILNVTPDSFSDGGDHYAPNDAVKHGLEMIYDGADIIDIGGESTRPGATEVEIDEEIRRTAPVIAGLREATDTPISIDTRKAPVARAASDAGANVVNDVAGFRFDAGLAPFCATQGLPVCVMHAQGTPDIMQKDPRYEDVVFDVYDFLQERVKALTELGIPQSRIIIDPGIGFGKTLDHNLALLRNLAIFHSIGCAVLLGASRKRFIGTIGGSEEARHRAPGSIAVTLAGIGQGVQLHRIHDVSATSEAVKLWRASTRGEV